MKYVFSVAITIILLVVINSCGSNNSSDNNNATDSLNIENIEINMLSKQEVVEAVKFIENLQNFVKNDDKQSIAKLINYPIYGIKTEQDFMNNYSTFINERVKKDILNVDMKDIFSNYQGVAVGNERTVWFSKVEHNNFLQITRINFEDPNSPANTDSECVYGNWINVKDTSEIYSFQPGWWNYKASHNEMQGEFRILDSKMTGWNVLNELSTKCKGKYLALIPEGLEPLEENIVLYTLKNEILTLKFADNTNSYKKIAN